MKTYREYSLALISTVITLCIALVGEFALHLSRDTIYLILAINTTITLTLTLLEKDMKEHTRFYNLIAEIDDGELQSKIIGIIENVSKGKIPPEIATLRSRERLKHTKKYFLAAEYDSKNTLQGIYNWEDNRRKKNWHEATLEMLKNGVSVERIFILKQAEVLISGRFDERASHILQKQEKDGVKIQVVWVEELEERPPQNNVLQGFAIYDGEEVIVETQFDRSWMYRPPADEVKLYQAIFKEQKKYSYGLADALNYQQSSRKE